MNAPGRARSVARPAGGIEGHPDTLRVLYAILAELRGLRADLRRDIHVAALRAALEDELGDAGFTVAGLLEIAETEPDSELARALTALVDMSTGTRSRATALGRLLANMPGIETCGDRRGAALYRLADLPDSGPQCAT